MTDQPKTADLSSSETMPVSAYLRCEHCVYWLRGYCIRFPPVAYQGGRMWPPTRASDVCGEHTPIGSDRRSFWRLKREAEEDPANAKNRLRGLLGSDPEAW